jgi:hypothetical protein
MFWSSPPPAWPHYVAKSALHWTPYAKIRHPRCKSGSFNSIGEESVSEIKTETTESTVDEDEIDEPTAEKEQDTTQNGPKFTEGPDPLAGVKKNVADAMASMEGKTVSMKVYVGTIIGIVVLMLLARCGG